MNQAQYSVKNQRTLRYYCDCFSALNVYTNNNKNVNALNQPILLLAVIELITQDIINDKYIRISHDLINTFKKYWNVLGHCPLKPDSFALPFFHLKNQKGKFWHLQFSSQYDGGRPQSIPKLKHDIDYAILDDELFNLLQDKIARKELIDALASTWFSTKKLTTAEILRINYNFQANLESEILSEAAITDTAPKKRTREYLPRDSFFRESVISVYNCKCAFCGLKVNKKINQNLVDGAHIKPFSLFFDNRVNNGISLCKNHHWAFDYGWFTLDEKYKIVVSHDLEEESPHAKPIKEFHGEKLLLPDEEECFPDRQALEWHRQNIFQG
jgi:putative restriction endonuclease